MAGFKDFFGAYKGAFTAGPTEPGTWRNHERFGRLTGTGEVEGELELPKGTVALGVEDHIAVLDLEVELSGPDGEPVALKRRGDHEDYDRAVHNLDRIGTGEVATTGLHRLRVRSPDPQEELVIAAGKDLTVKEMIAGAFPGSKLLGRG